MIVIVSELSYSPVYLMSQSSIVLVVNVALLMEFLEFMFFMFQENSRSSFGMNCLDKSRVVLFKLVDICLCTLNAFFSLI